MTNLFFLLLFSISIAFGLSPLATARVAGPAAVNSTDSTSATKITATTEGATAAKITTATDVTSATKITTTTEGATAAKITTPADLAAPEQKQKFSGVVIEKGTKRVLSDLAVFVLPEKLKALSNSKGEFQFDELSFGVHTIVVNAADFQKYEIDFNFSPGSLVKPFVIFLERQNYQGLRETVVDRVKKRDDTTRVMKAEQFLSMPGANGDPVKALQNLPGVTRTNGFSSQILIQGSAAQDTSYLIDEHSVPLVFHFGGLTSVVTPEAVEQVDYLSAGYGPEYGRAMGGLVGLKSKVPAMDRKRGYIFADLTKAGALLEGPIDETSSYLVSARYSYLSLILKQALKNSPRFDLTVAPAFSDLSVIYSSKLSARDDLKLLTMGSFDELKFVLNEPVREQPSVRGSFNTETYFYRFIPQWTHRYETGEIAKFSIGLGQDSIKFDVGENFLNIKASTVTQRAELEHKHSSSWISYFGMDNQYRNANVNFSLPVATNSGGVGQMAGRETVQADVVGTSYLIGPYWRNKIKNENSPWTWMPNLRLDHFSSSNETKLQPRFALRYDQDESFFYRAAVGLYSQPPQPQELALSYGNPNLKSPSATHFVFGIEKDFRAGSSDGFLLASTVFYKDLRELVITSTQRNSDGSLERYNNNGSGHSQGLEVSLRYEEKPWSAWLSYTYSQSYRKTPAQGEFLFSNDQTHNLNLVGGVELPRNWKLTSRFRYVTGNPNTPVVGGLFDSDNDVYVPIRGAFYSERTEAFYQLDLRADKKWIYDTWILWAYLDIQNATNRANSEGVRYSYDYSIKTNITGLPILPILGVRGEF